VIIGGSGRLIADLGMVIVWD